MKPNVVTLLGGLGNQLFQVAHGLELEIKTGRPTTYDFSQYRSRRRDYLGVLDFMWRTHLKSPSMFVWIFPTPQGRLALFGKALRMLHSPRKLVFEADLKDPKDWYSTSPAWFFGYWQTNDISAQVATRIRAAVSGHSSFKPEHEIAVHVRRGDMLGNSDELNISYYERAYELLLEKTGLTTAAPVDVFSDDPEWCARNLPFRIGILHRSNRASIDLSNFSKYQNQILSASTFSWWSAKLRESDAGVVVCPDPFSTQSLSQLRAENNWLVVSR